MAHASTAMSRMKDLTKSCRQGIASIHNTRAMAQDDVTLVSSFLNGEVLNLNVVCTITCDMLTWTDVFTLEVRTYSQSRCVRTNELTNYPNEASLHRCGENSVAEGDSAAKEHVLFNENTRHTTSLARWHHATSFLKQI